MVRVINCTKVQPEQRFLQNYNSEKKRHFSSLENLFCITVCKHISRFWEEPLGYIPVCQHQITPPHLPKPGDLSARVLSCSISTLSCPHSAHPLSNHPSTPLRSDPKSNDDNGFTPKWPNLLPLQDLVL